MRAGVTAAQTSPRRLFLTPPWEQTESEHRFPVGSARRSDPWEVGQAPGDYPPDRGHVMACLAELLATEHLTLDARHVLVAGHSGGASSAPYLATNEEPFTAFAVLHGGAFPGGFGRRRVRGWFSTGDADGLRTPIMVTRAYEASRDPASSYGMHVFAGGHALGEEERRALVTSWLGDAGPATGR